MLLLDLVRSLRGYVRFTAQGGMTERFLGRLARNSIPVWAGQKHEDTYTGCVHAKDYPKLRQYAKDTGVRLHITQKHGAPFVRRRYRKRTGVLAGLLIFFCFLYGMSLFIWRIDVEGTVRVSETAILQALEQLDITPGTLRRSIDVRECEQKLLLLVPDLSWSALNIDGSALHVKVSESVLPPEMIDENIPCNITAAYNGQITAMNVYAGQKLVAIGDTVLAGDLLVSGITQDGRGQSLFRHARAEIFARTAQTLEVSVPLAQTHYTETGSTKCRRYLDLFGLELPLFLPTDISSPYRVNRETLPLKVFGQEVPVTLHKENYILMQEAPVTLTEEEAKEEALRQLALLEQTHLSNAQILGKTVTAALKEKNFVLSAQYTCILDIAHEQEILVQGSAE